MASLCTGCQPLAFSAGIRATHSTFGAASPLAPSSSSSAASSLGQGGYSSGGGAAAAAGVASIAALLSSRRTHRSSRNVRRVQVRVAPGFRGNESNHPDLTNEVPATEDEAMEISGTRLGGTPMKLSTWPPKAVVGPGGNVRIAQLEGRIGKDCVELPKFQTWPLYEAELSSMPGLVVTEEDLKDYRLMDFSAVLDKAFLLAGRWQTTTVGRSMGFSQTGAGKLSSFKACVPILMRQLQGVASWGKWCAKNSSGAESFESFIKDSGADEFIATELRTLVAHSGYKGMHVSALMGSTRGSALGIWSVDAAKGTATVEMCMGHDCLEQGPAAEEMLIRLIGGEASALGATKIQCRGRLTEGGLLLAPPCVGSLGLTRVAPQAGDPEFVENTGDEQTMAEMVAAAEGSSFQFDMSIEECVPGLRNWLLVLYLEDHLKAVNSWCLEMGAATMAEVTESREDLVEALGDVLDEDEKQRVLARDF
ncbi:unnamed protein product [Polarella glacialis]|uniref:Uncharacterized protein n=1 Tax=Polarella glacialis TaxID=89957 RepID=A0A813FGG9_POLGL|nr:unnamed protein product [Polarella glacialis]